MFPHQQQKHLRNGGGDHGNMEAATPDDHEFLEQMLSSWNQFATHSNESSAAWDLNSATLHHQILMNGNGFGDASSFPDSGAATINQAQGINGSAPPAAAAAGAHQPRQRVRARRGQATDPHSIAERLRRERIADRMKGLQELVPNANKTDKASMLDEIIDYVKFLQLQVKVLSMSRLGGAAAMAPLVAERGDDIDNALAMTEQQVAKLMEEDTGSAMQYLQGKGLCLMPISLATAISTATCHSIPHNNNNSNGGSMFVANGNGPTSPSASVLTVLNDATSDLGQ